MKPIAPKPVLDLKVPLTPSQIELFKETIWGNNCVSKAITYADIHFNTLKKAMKIKKKMHEIRKSQRDKLIEYCEIIQQEKAA